MRNLVFIVEDNPVDQTILRMHFEEVLGNYTVQTFSKPEDMFAWALGLEGSLKSGTLLLHKEEARSEEGGFSYSRVLIKCSEQAPSPK